MTRTDRVRKMLAEGKLSMVEISDKVGVSKSYVRTVKQRMEGRNPDKAYTAKVIPLGDREAARTDYSRAYRTARRRGLTRKEAAGCGSAAYSRTMRKTGAKALRLQSAGAQA